MAERRKAHRPDACACGTPLDQSGRVPKEFCGDCLAERKKAQDRLAHKRRMGKWRAQA